jgi:DNA-binding NarL/FixJ family response regulator
MASSSSNVVTVLIVDDHRMYSDALHAILEPEPGISVLGQVYDSREAKAKIAACHPHVVLMDFNMPHLNGIELTKLLLHETPELKILFLSMYNEERLIESFKDIGARGYLSKTASADEVIRATRKVYAGELYFPKSGITKSNEENNLIKKLILSDREMEVVRLIKVGLKTKEIAETLHISYYTAETHRNNIKLKTGLKGETDFIRFILEMRLP